MRATPYFDVNFNPSDGPLDITDYDGSGTSPDFKSEDQYTDFYGEGKGGKVLNGRVASGVHVEGRGLRLCRDLRGLIQATPVAWSTAPIAPQPRTT